MITIYHNPRCTKSRQALALLEEKGQDFVVKEYLNHPPTKEELTQVIELLGIKPHDLIRRGESIYKESFKGKDLTDDQWIDAMLDHPKLIERPIVIKDDKAEIGRPTENILNLL